MRRYALYLINPKRRYRYQWDMQELCRIMRKGTGVHPLALPTLAAHTPERYDITIMDEEMEELRFTPLPDLVGLTALAPSVKRAYEIADRFRSKGVPVIMGGPQVTFNVEESLRHCDALILGEAEDIWPEALADFERGALKKTYQRTAPYEFRTSPVPRWDLVNTRRIMALGVQASRGCPYTCEFCLVRNMFGVRQRYRDLDDLIHEIQALPKRQIGFVDDNLCANKPYAHALMQRLEPLGVTWSCQCSLDVCEDDALLAAMARAGCTSLLLGIESLNEECLRETGKRQNKVERYEAGIRRIHSHGIHVIGSFIVGFDADRLDAFEKIFEFTVRTDISLVMLNVLTAYPGTDTYTRLKAAGRITAIDPDLLNGIYPTMQHYHISQTDMFRTYFQTLERMFEPAIVREKALRVFATGAFRRYTAGDITATDKVLSLIHLTRFFVLSGNRERRRLLTDLLRLAWSGQAQIGHVVEFLLMISSFVGYLEFTKEHRAWIMERIARQDPGPVLPEPSLVAVAPAAAVQHPSEE
jgi:radical SAM superfamily enzyme YgiQ (UPF0313 family)